MTRPIQEERLKARVRKRYKRTTMSELDQPIAANLLQQEFTAERPNQRSVGDTSELRIGDNGRRSWPSCSTATALCGRLGDQRSTIAT